MRRGARRRAEEKQGHVCVGWEQQWPGRGGETGWSSAALAGARRGHRQEDREVQPRAESGRVREAPEFTLEIKLFISNKSLYAVTFDDCQFVKNLWHHQRGAYVFIREPSLGFPGGSDGEESACHAGDPGSIPGSRRSLEEGMATHSNIFAWRISRTEEPGRL